MLHLLRLTPNFYFLLHWLFTKNSFLKLKASHTRRGGQSLLTQLNSFNSLIEIFQHRFPIFLSKEICKVFVVLTNRCRLCWILNISMVCRTLIKKFVDLLLFFIFVLVKRRQLNTRMNIHIFSILHDLPTRQINFIFLPELDMTVKSYLLICKRCYSLLECGWRSKLNRHIVERDFFGLANDKWRLSLHNLSNRWYFTFPFWGSFMTGKLRLRKRRNKLILCCFLMY